MYDRRLVRTAEFDGIGDQVLEDLLEMDTIHPHRRQMVADNLRTTLLDGSRQVGEHVAKDVCGINRFSGFLLSGSLRIDSQTVEEGFHPRGPTSNLIEEH